MYLRHTTIRKNGKARTYWRLVRSVRTERGREFGGVWMAWTRWRALRLDTLLEGLMPRGEEEIPCSRVAEILVAARLCEPSSELHIAEDWHQKEERVKAHILVCFLAYVLWKTLEQWQSAAGLGNSPRTILDELGRIQSTDVVLPTQDGRELRLRCVVQPDRAQGLLLERLGLRRVSNRRASKIVSSEMGRS